MVTESEIKVTIEELVMTVVVKAGVLVMSVNLEESKVEVVVNPAVVEINDNKVGESILLEKVDNTSVEGAVNELDVDVNNVFVVSSKVVGVNETIVMGKNDEVDGESVLLDK